MKTIRRAVSLLLGAAFIAGCNERNAPTGMTEKPGPAFSADATGTPTSVVLDPVGDVEKKGNDYQDVVRAEITTQGGNFVFVMDLAAPLPDNPSVPSKADVILWLFALDTDPTEFQVGYPHNGAEPWEFFVELRQYREGFTDPLDPTRSAGVLVDRRPLFTGGQATVTPIQFSIKGTKIAWVVDAASLGDPSTFKWASGTASAHANDDAKTGYAAGVVIFDVAPDADLATWPQ